MDNDASGREDQPARPIPQPSAESIAYWQAAAHDELQLQRCARCGAVQSLPRSVCQHCRAAELIWFRALGHGRVASFTHVERGPTPAFKTPYTLALIDLVEGSRLMLNLIGEDRLGVAIGDPIRIVFEARGDQGFKLPQARRLVQA